MSGRRPWSEIKHKRRERISAEDRAWSEYLAWTRHAEPWQYVETEERAWHRLERALLPLRLRPWISPPAQDDPLPGGESEPVATPKGESDA